MSHDNNQTLTKLASELVENLVDCQSAEQEIVQMYEAWALKRLIKAFESVEKRALDAESRVSELEEEFAFVSGQSDQYFAQLQELQVTRGVPACSARPVEIPDFRVYCGSNVKYRVAKDMIAYAIREAGHEVKRND
ncbi:hypothetical protein NIM72_07900 [Pantoea sp. B550]|uniref:hypothetical protein n=1 Tax=Pantoea sp. B550 TaxID=2959338 RepID=UPI00209EA061|nr:hypothetical protein [Pantoea sp. B550]MCP1205467.1 hypothetical protein [Pantoea sp. B550]